MTTFTDEQWENFAFVVADDPMLASLMPQVNSVNPEPNHEGYLIPINASGKVQVTGKSDHSRK